MNLGNIEVHKEENLYVAIDSVTGIASQGATEESAGENLNEVLKLFYEDDYSS